MADAVEPCMPFRIGAHDMPGCPGGVSGVQHLVSSVGVVVPKSARFEICGAKLPLSERILNPSLKAPCLFLLPHLKPVLDQPDAVVNHDLLESGAEGDEFAVLL